MKCKNYLLSLLENIPLWYEDVQLKDARMCSASSKTKLDVKNKGDECSL